MRSTSMMSISIEHPSPPAIRFLWLYTTAALLTVANYYFYSQPLIEQVYRSRPPSAATLRPLYFAHPAPRPSLLYFPSTSPPVTVFSVVQSNLLFLAVSEVDTEPLLALEFLHRVVDVLEEFVGAPLISTKIQSNYDVVAQLLHEMCDGGLVCNTELNALQEVVDMPGWMGKLLGGVGLVFKLRGKRVVY